MSTFSLVRVLPIAVGLALFSSITSAVETEATATPAGLSNALQRLVPGRLPDSVEETPYKGLYEVAYGSEVVYISGDGAYMLDGNLTDLKTRENLTEKRLSTARNQQMKTIDENSLITYPAKGERKHSITVFTDIDCTYCRKLHSGMEEMNELGIEVKYAGFPRAGETSGSAKKLESVWCAEDQQGAMDLAKQGNQPDMAECSNPIASHYQLGRKVGVTGTPALVTESGQLLPGYLPPKRLLNRLDNLKRK